jgi:hypothetical protein
MTYYCLTLALSDEYKPGGMSLSYPNFYPHLLAAQTTIQLMGKCWRIFASHWFEYNALNARWGSDFGRVGNGLSPYFAVTRREQSDSRERLNAPYSLFLRASSFVVQHEDSMEIGPTFCLHSRCFRYWCQGFISIKSAGYADWKLK